ncbi:bass: bile acid transporter [Tepidimonas sediminis]|uniref:Bass: bile acid transporter n=1 Tax=Tepidimonas sediminis TaxID=2588941 RepID=A0A554WTI8_9BURK|nr:arsenic resistance protein [Tepidimonas sediminis]TSE26895.1 bass: bile acid transporter [Tepidimonas sediminis]
MDRFTLERHQVWLYLLAIALGWAAGSALPALAPLAAASLWPVLALLLLATFAQIPLLHVRRAWRDARFARAVLLGNFVAVPLLVWALVAAFGLHGAQRLGVLLVLLVPCTDWFITFTQLGRGDAARAIAVTPLNLILQLALLPIYLAAMADAQALAGWSWADLLPAVALVAGPLALAAALERRAGRAPRWQRVRERLAWWPVPLLALVVGLIACAQVAAVGRAWDAVAATLPLFALYLVGALALAWGLARAHGLPPAQGRTLAFSLGTRNSFVVLPLALALPPGWEAVAVVIVAQSLVELLGMVACVALVPRLWRENDDA